MNKHKKIVGTKLEWIKEYLEKTNLVFLKLMTFTYISKMEKGVLGAFPIQCEGGREGKSLE